MSNLSEFFADHDVSAIRQVALDSHNIDILGVYCLHTGRKVGTFDESVIQFAIEEETASDDESMADALVARTVASMRPTPMLNRPDRITLLNLADKFPVDVVCYLIHRLHSNRWLATHRDPEILAPYIWRIHNHQLWSSLAAAKVDLRPWIHWLLELDSKRNLHDLTPPTGEYDRTGKWIETKTGESLFTQLTASNQAEMLEIFARWTYERIAEFDSRHREAAAQDRWMRGNTMTQPAYARSWLENPQFASKRAEQEYLAKHKKSKAKLDLNLAKPKKASKLDERLGKFLHLLEATFEGEQEEVTPAKPAPKILTGAMLFRKKESI